MKKLLFALMIMAFFAACGGGEQATQQEQQEQQEQQTTQEATEAVAEVTIEGNDMMQYNLKTIEVTEGQTVKLTLKHVGEMTKEAMGHNWILLNQGVDKAEFAAAAIGAIDNDYIPEDKTSEIIAHTKTLGGGEETTIEFAAPAVGEYEFICSFPGHYAMMTGIFTVKAK
jgi:azurin